MMIFVMNVYKVFILVCASNITGVEVPLSLYCTYHKLLSVIDGCKRHVIYWLIVIRYTCIFFSNPIIFTKNLIWELLSSSFSNFSMAMRDSERLMAGRS